MRPPFLTNSKYMVYPLYCDCNFKTAPTLLETNDLQFVWDKFVWLTGFPPPLSPLPLSPSASFLISSSMKRRSRVFDDACVLPRLIHEVKAATSALPAPTNDSEDPVFDAPTRASPEATRALFQAFTFLRDSCAGCPANNEALRETELASTASKLQSLTPVALQSLSHPNSKYFPPKTCEF